MKDLVNVVGVVGEPLQNQIAIAEAVRALLPGADIQFFDTKASILEALLIDSGPPELDLILTNLSIDVDHTVGLEVVKASWRWLIPAIIVRESGNFVYVDHPKLCVRRRKSEVETWMEVIDFLFVERMQVVPKALGVGKRNVPDNGHGTYLMNTVSLEMRE